MKKRIIILCTFLPFLFGFIMASSQGKNLNQGATIFHTNNMPPTDMIILSNKGDIYELTAKGNNQITHNQNLIEPVLVGNNILAVEKRTNYASLVMYNQSGDKTKTLFNGNTGSIDTMSWATDPSVHPDRNNIAYVSDKDKGQTNIPDNALYELTLSDGKSTTIANPAPYSGGIAHPIFNPINGNILLYDYYQYDPETSLPYSTIEQYNKETRETKTLSFENKNAYQESFSPDGKQLLFLGRNGDTSIVTLFVADYTSNGLVNIHALATGDFAYPVFSNTQNQIYYLEAKANNEYNLVTATVKKNKLTNILPITTGSQLLGNSSFAVTTAK